MRRLYSCLLLSVFISAFARAADKPSPGAPGAPGAPVPAATADAKDKKDDAIVSLFDGKTMGKWKVTNFGGEGEVETKDGVLVIKEGNPLSGVTWKEEPPARMNYEITLEAQRTEGGDFFLGLTVPVNKENISLILGGWGGGVSGLSSIDGMDASENETTQFLTYKKGQWYKVRLRVLEKRITAWLDGKCIVDVDTTEKKIGIRIEVDASCPLGIATYSTTGSFRDIKLKKLSAEEAKKAAEEKIEVKKD